MAITTNPKSLPLQGFKVIAGGKTWLKNQARSNPDLGLTPKKSELWVEPGCTPTPGYRRMGDRGEQSRVTPHSIAVYHKLH